MAASAPSLGVIRLDYDYLPVPGDVDHPQSFAYNVFYRVVPGFTFEMCQSGVMTAQVREEFISALEYLTSQGVAGITGDCGFMMFFQRLARETSKLPVFMSSLAQLPAVTCAYAPEEQVAIFTANKRRLEPMRQLIREECGIEVHNNSTRFVIIGCEDVPGFESVAIGARGEEVDVTKVTLGVVGKAVDVLSRHPQVRAFLFECTELGCYSDAVRAATGLPVFDAITACDFFIGARKDNARFGGSWQQPAHTFGQGLGAASGRSAQPGDSPRSQFSQPHRQQQLRQEMLTNALEIQRLQRAIEQLAGQPAPWPAPQDTQPPAWHLQQQPSEPPPHQWQPYARPQQGGRPADVPHVPAPGQHPRRPTQLVFR